MTVVTGSGSALDLGDLYSYERALARAGASRIAGVDEAGRGACAGPLVAAAVVLGEPIEGLNDSKLLSAKKREIVYQRILDHALAVEVVMIHPAEIDQWGVQAANISALRRAVARLDIEIDYVLSDGYPIDGLRVDSLAVFKGDRVCASIAAASVVAKVSRDRLMDELDLAYPHYGFAAHKGYGTASHNQALVAHGPCEHHRLSYANVQAARESR